MTQPENLHLDARLVPDLATAIDRWLTARDAYKMLPSDESQNEYNATLFELGAAWSERYPEGVTTPDAFPWYQRGLTAPEDDWSSSNRI